MVVTNTKAYYDKESMKAIKSFIVQAQNSLKELRGKKVN
jgi:hypothetical protein